MTPLHAAADTPADLAAPTWAEAVTAMNALAVELEANSRPAEAVVWYRRAANAGHFGAAYNLGLHYRDLGNAGEAALWFEQAAQEGDTEAAYALGVLALQHDEPEQAQHWLEMAAGAGDSDARNALGALRWQQGQLDRARQLWEQAHTDVPAAAYNLAMLESYNGGSDSDVEYWLTQAALRCDPDAAYELGLRAQSRDELAEAEARFRLADQAGHAQARAALIGLLTERGAVEQAQALVKHQPK